MAGLSYSLMDLAISEHVEFCMCILTHSIQYLYIPDKALRTAKLVILAYCIIWCCRYRLETSSHNTPGASESDTSCKQCSNDALFCQRGTSARHSMATKWTRSFSARSSIYHSRLWDAADLRYRVFRRS